jgi:hypothetical protein
MKSIAVLIFLNSSLLIVWGDSILRDGTPDKTTQ